MASRGPEDLRAGAVWAQSSTGQDDPHRRPPRAPLALGRRSPPRGDRGQAPRTPSSVPWAVPNEARTEVSRGLPRGYSPGGNSMRRAFAHPHPPRHLGPEQKLQDPASAAAPPAHPTRRRRVRIGPPGTRWRKPAHAPDQNQVWGSKPAHEKSVPRYFHEARFVRNFARLDCTRSEGRRYEAFLSREPRAALVETSITKEGSPPNALSRTGETHLDAASSAFGRSESAVGITKWALTGPFSASVSSSRACTVPYLHGLRVGVGRSLLNKREPRPVTVASPSPRAWLVETLRRFPKPCRPWSGLGNDFPPGVCHKSPTPVSHHRRATTPSSPSSESRRPELNQQHTAATSWQPTHHAVSFGISFPLGR